MEDSGIELMVYDSDSFELAKRRDLLGLWDADLLEYIYSWEDLSMTVLSPSNALPYHNHQA